MCQSSNHFENRNGVGMPPNVSMHTSLMLYYGQNMHQVMEYHEHSYLVSLLFAAPFLLFIIFSKFFSTCNKYNQLSLAADFPHTSQQSEPHTCIPSSLYSKKS